MRIIDRYLISHFIKSLLYVVALLVLLFVVLDLFNNINEFLRHGVTIQIVLSYYLYLLPSMMSQIAPIACLAAILFSLGDLHRHHEVIALKTGGLSAFTIISPYLFIGILISMLLFASGEKWVPQSKINSQSIMQGLILKGKKDLKDRSISNLTYYGQNHRMIFAREFEVINQTLHDVVIFEDNPTEPQQMKITAKKVRFEDGRWILYESLKQNLNRRGDIVGEPEFSSKAVFDLPEKPDDFIREASQSDLMSSSELRRYIKNLKGTSRKLINRLWVDFYYRVAFSFTALVVMVMGAPLAMRGVRQNAAAGFGTGLVVIVIYYAIESVSLAMGKGGHLPPILAAWMANILLAASGIYLIKNTS